MLRPLFTALSPAGAKARLSVLILHRVLAQPDPLFPGEIDAACFRQICGWLRQWFNVLPLDEACRLRARQALPARALSITFDDGYADNHDVALPILQEFGLTATFFVATGFLDGGRMWNDTVIEALRRTKAESLDLADAGLPGVSRLALGSVVARLEAIETVIGAIKYLPVAQRTQVTAAIARAAGAKLPTDLMMRSDQVSALHRAGMTVGAHTVNHPILATLDDAAARNEIQSGKVKLEQLIQAPVTVFAYPNGRPGRDFHAANALQVQSLGFEAAVTTAWGAASSEDNPFQLPRFTPWDRSHWRFGLRMARNMRAPPTLVTALKL